VPQALWGFECSARGFAVNATRLIALRTFRWHVVEVSVGVERQGIGWSIGDGAACLNERRRGGLVTSANDGQQCDAVAWVSAS
jgi:hypothetical protein